MTIKKYLDKDEIDIFIAEYLNFYNKLFLKSEKLYVLSPAGGMNSKVDGCLISDFLSAFGRGGVKEIYRYYREGDRIPENFIPFAIDYADNLFGVVSKKDGLKDYEVYYWEHDIPLNNELSELVKVSGSLSGFFESLELHNE